ncbi:unnamed protein product [Nippostrongylus brasiliensis]|uniref:DUF1963 domain-containing protein n=1 Tax=Nippostrongylus brasiliensis TaxID=27835 RepID=A0A0N4XDV3_NIPBR|nr:unnamed protein product [Nippostrongylus brasiliensis]
MKSGYKVTRWSRTNERSLTRHTLLTPPLARSSSSSLQPLLENPPRSMLIFIGLKNHNDGVDNEYEGRPWRLWEVGDGAKKAYYSRTIDWPALENPSLAN